MGFLETQCARRPHVVAIVSMLFATSVSSACLDSVFAPVSDAVDGQATDATVDMRPNDDPDVQPTDAGDLVEEPVDAVADSIGPDVADLSDAADLTDLSDVADVVDEDAGPTPVGPARYVEGRIHSPLNDSVVANLRDIARMDTGRNSAVFMKVGDSISIDTNFLTCLASGDIDLTGHTELQDALTHFRTGDAAGTTPFDRGSEATLGGRTAS